MILYAYIEKIKNHGFWAGNNEITQSSFLFCLNTNFYKLEDDDDKVFKHYSLNMEM